MQRKEACSVPLLAGEPCQTSPPNSYILNYVILRNKVQSQFIKNMHPCGGWGGELSATQKQQQNLHSSLPGCNRKQNTYLKANYNKLG